MLIKARLQGLLQVYTASVSAADTGAQRKVLNLQATDADRGSFGTVTYIVSSVTEGAENNFFYDAADGALYARGNLVPDQQYQVI